MGKFCWHNICIFSKKIGLIAEAELKILFWKCVNDGPVKCPDPVTPANGGGHNHLLFVDSRVRGNDKNG